MSDLKNNHFATGADPSVPVQDPSAIEEPMPASDDGPGGVSVVIPPHREIPEGIAPMHVSCFTIGYIDSIPGPEGCEHLAWVTVDEIEVLCREYAERLLAIDEEFCWRGGVSSTGIRMLPYAKCSLNYFVTLIGAERVNAIVDDVYKDFDPPDIQGVFQDSEHFDWEVMFSNGYAGNCPECQHHTGVLNIGPEHWLYCDEHCTKWHVGHDRLSGWRDQTPEEWGQAVLKLLDYREVKPAYPPHRNGLIVVRDHPCSPEEFSSSLCEAVPETPVDEEDDCPFYSEST